MVLKKEKQKKSADSHWPTLVHTSDRVNVENAKDTVQESM